MGHWDRLRLDRKSTDPLYRQLADQIRGWIATGELAPGERLPPSRELAERLGVNRNTIASVYDELAKSGDVRSRVGQGTFVATTGPIDSPRAPLRFRFSRATEAAAERVQKPPIPTSHPDPIDFATLVPDEGLFPIEPFRAVLDDVLRREGKTLLQYGPAAGYPPLRAYIAARLAERGVRATSENVLIVNGSQQGLDLVCRSLLDPGDRVALESPTYTIVLPLLAQYHAQTEPIPMTERGMDLDALESVLDRSRPKLVFTMPTFHNPTGITMDLDSRKRLLELTSRYGTPVVEDDFDSELRFDGDSLPPLKALDERGSVLHIGTFSKGLFPGLRLGYVVAEEAVVSILGRSKLIADYYSSLLLQAATLEFCRAGHYDRHLKRLASIYRDKSRVLTGALERFFPREVTWTRPEGGWAFWVTLPEALSAELLLEESARGGVLFTPGTHFFARGEGDRYLRLSISKVPTNRIEEGIERLSAILVRHLGSLGTIDGGRTRALRHEPALHI
jgi:GntR family transcriptional regulator/MocR family aminotransferase